MRMWGKRRRYVFRKRSKRGRALWLAAGLLLLLLATVVGLVWLVLSWPTSPAGSNVQAPQQQQSAPPEERPEPGPVEDGSEPQGTQEGEKEAGASEDAPPPSAEEGAAVASPAAPPERLAPPPSPASPAPPVTAPSSSSAVGPSPSGGGKAGVPGAPLRAPNGYATPEPNSYYYPDYSWGYGPGYPDYSWGYGGSDYYYWDYEPDYWDY
jgi:hypothetical protein